MAIVVRRNLKTNTQYYQVRVQDPDGKWYPTRAFSRRDEAVAEEKRLKTLKRHLAQVFSRDARAYSLQNFWEVWSELNRTEVSDGWKLSQDQMYRDYIEPVLGSLKLSEIGKPEISKALSRVKQMGRSSAMRRHVYVLLHQMFTSAIKCYEMLTVSPVVAEIHMPALSKRAQRYLDPDASHVLLDIAQAHPVYGPPVTIQVLAGLRAEAVIALLWEQVDWARNRIWITRAWKQKEKRVANYPKGRDHVFAHMPHTLQEYLWGVWERGARERWALVCPNRQGERLSYSTYLHALKRLCAQAGVRELGTQGLRHSMAELWLDEGASVEDVRRQLNHKQASTTELYIHRSEARLQEIAKRVGKPRRSSFPGEETRGREESVYPESDTTRNVH